MAPLDDDAVTAPLSSPPPPAPPAPPPPGTPSRPPMPPLPPAPPFPPAPPALPWPPSPVESERHPIAGARTSTARPLHHVHASRIRSSVSGAEHSATRQNDALAEQRCRETKSRAPTRRRGGGPEQALCP
ncbi:hypothetical protein E8A74_00685 [Polyangium fumosum]|uniref:Uncharacterized protein n=1 Tax=Polyangium fumosum TaxID=889272 RepID=A0A4U1JK37_9BACT|nr:hypothetical protein E8A74_00685 [Polyangium fumosum]